jgi:hypothetical protein
MKTSLRAATTAVIITSCCLISGLVSGQTIPSVPIGTLTTPSELLREGTNAQLTWKITYPAVVKDFVTITPPATVTSNQNLYVDVRVLGAGVTASSGNSTSFTYVPTEAQIKLDDGSYSRIFYGTNQDVNPNTIVYSHAVNAGKSLKFGGRYFYCDEWGPNFTSDSGTQNVRTLVNGDTPPANLPDYGAPSLESFLGPYLDAAGKIKIGPLDVIVYMELTHTDAQMADSGYDLQDMVLLITYRTN